MTPLLDASGVLLLRAATRSDAEAVNAFIAWRQSHALDDIDYSAYRAMPMLVEAARRHGIVDPDLERMRGIGRYIWTANMLQLRLLFAALDALGQANVTPLLLKGAAVFARAPELAAKRLASDYDILLRVEDLPAARAALQAAGFEGNGYDWDDIEAGMPGTQVCGAPIRWPDLAGDIDLHWRSLPRLHDPALTERLFAGAETRSLQRRAVKLPSLAHHLFTAIARCEPWDRGEVLHRLIECHFLIVDGGGGVDWDELAKLSERYRLRQLAHEALQTLVREAQTPVPPALLQQLNHPAMDRQYWRVSAVAPGERTPLQHWVIGRGDARAGRSDPEVRPAGLFEALLRQFGGRLPGHLPLLWRWALARQGGVSKGGSYVEGFSYPEAGGRWTEGLFSLLRLPLPPGNGPIAEVALDVAVFLGKNPLRRVRICAGADVVSTSFGGPQHDEKLRFRARRNVRLGGDALVLIEQPDASSPCEAGQSTDIRRLGMFLPRPRGRPML